MAALAVVALQGQGGIDPLAQLLVFRVKPGHPRQYQMLGRFRLAEIDPDLGDHLFDLANRLRHGGFRGEILSLVEQGVGAADDDSGNAGGERVSHCSTPSLFGLR